MRKYRLNVTKKIIAESIDNLRQKNTENEVFNICLICPVAITVQRKFNNPDLVVGYNSIRASYDYISLPLEVQSWISKLSWRKEIPKPISFLLELTTKQEKLLKGL
jgi:hypothetical protein